MEEAGGHTYPDPEVFIYKTTNNTKQQTAVKEREHQKMRQVDSQRQTSLMHEAGSKGDAAVVQSLIEPQLKALKDQQASRMRPESVYNNPGGRIGIPKYGPSLEPAIHGGPDFPTIYARVLTLAETEDLQKQLKLRENLLLRREVPKVCNMRPYLVLPTYRSI